MSFGDIAIIVAIVLMAFKPEIMAWLADRKQAKARKKAILRRRQNNA